jgi:preprotein translocase subunit SecY
MNLKILNLFRIPDLRRKLMITVGLLLVYRIGFHVPLPGVDVDALREAAEQSGTLAALFGIMSSLTGGSLGSAALFSLGVMPYISASIIFSLLTKVMPSLETLSKEGAAGQRKINQYTRLATIPICLFQSLFVIYGVLRMKTAGGGDLVPPDVWGVPYILGTMVALTAGTFFIMWLGEQITEHGLGNGISIIIMAGIIATIPKALVGFLNRAALGADEKFQTMLLYTLAWVLTVFVIVYITKGQRRIPIQQAKRTQGRKVYGGQRHFLPFKVNQAGVMPIIFAAALMMLPNLMARIPGLRFFSVFQDPSGWWYILVYSIFIIFFAFFWVQMMFQPKEIADNLREYGSFIPGIRPGKKTAEYLGYIMKRVTLAGSIFLCLIAVLPNIITKEIGNLQGTSFAYFLGGTSILIVVEVALDLVEQINAQMVMKNYDGFMKGEATNRTGWGRNA